MNFINSQKILIFLTGRDEYPVIMNGIRLAFSNGFEGFMADNVVMSGKVMRKRRGWQIHGW